MGHCLDSLFQFAPCKGLGPIDMIPVSLWMSCCVVAAGLLASLAGDLLLGLLLLPFRSRQRVPRHGLR